MKVSHVKVERKQIPSLQKKKTAMTHRKHIFESENFQKHLYKV